MLWEGFSFGTARELEGGCEMAVSWCVFTCDTARGVRFGQCVRGILVLALPVVWDSGSVGVEYCF